MFLQLAHKQLYIYKVSKELVFTCYKLTNSLPPDERFNMIQQRFFEIARGSLIEIDAALEIDADLSYINKEEQKKLGELIIRCFQMLSKMITPRKV